MTTGTRQDYATLYRTFAEMYDNLDFIQTLDRLQSGEPLNMAASNSSYKVEGTNRPIARLAHSMDAILDQVMLLKTATVTGSSSTKVVWTGSNLSLSASINIKIKTIAAGKITGASSGSIEYTLNSFSFSTAGVDWGYIVLPMNPTSGLTVSIVQASDADLNAKLESTDRIKVLPVFRKTTEGIVWMLGRQELIRQNYDFYPSSLHNRYYATNSNLQTIGNVSVGGSGNVSWIKNGALAGYYNLTLPAMTFTGPNISHSYAGGTYSLSLQDGHALFINLVDGSDTILDLNTSNLYFFNSEELRFMVCARVGNDVYFWNGLKLTGTTVASTGTTVDLFNYAQALVRIPDSGTSYYLEMASDSTTNFTANRTLTFDLDDASKTLKLGGSASLYNFEASSFTVEGSVDLGASTQLTLADNSYITLAGTSPSFMSLTDAYVTMAANASIDLEANCYINLDSTSFITADNSTLDLGTNNTVSLGGDLTTTADLSVTLNCTIDQNLSTSSAVQFTDISLVTYTNAQAGTSNLFVYRGSGTSGSPANVIAGSRIFEISGNAYNTFAGGFDETSYLRMVSVGTYSGTQAGEAAAKIVFGTSPGGGGASPVERMVITEQGYIGIGNNAPTNPVSIKADGDQLYIRTTTSSDNATITVDTSGNTTIEATGAIELVSNTDTITANNVPVLREEMSVIVKLAGSTNSTYGIALPTMDSQLRSNPGESLINFASNLFTFSQWNLSSTLDRAGSMWIAPRNGKIIGIRFSSEISFGSFDASGLLNDGTYDYPGDNALSSGWVCPTAVKTYIQIHKIEKYSGATPKDGGILTATTGNVSTDPIAIVGFLYASIFDSADVIGDGDTSGAVVGNNFYKHSAGTEASGVPTGDTSFSAGDGLLIRLIDPYTGPAGGTNESYTSRIDISAATIPNPWVKVTLLLEYI